jgi:GxxExxY protein
MPAPQIPLLEEQLTHDVIGAFFTVHRALGYGYREYIYALALERELVARGHRVAREVAVMVYYRGEPLARQTLDMLVDNKLIVEIKAAEHLHPAATVQLFSYLCTTKLEVGLLLHFGRDGRFYRVICENRLKAHHTASEIDGSTPSSDAPDAPPP